MAITLMQYAYLANAAYAEDSSELRESLQKSGLQQGKGKKVVGFRPHKWEGVNKANGYQGTILQSEDDVVVAIKGTRLSSGKDLWNDLVLAVNRVPSQAEPASAMVEAARSIARTDKKTFSIVGHSLGGGLAQYVGYLSGADFVTFNAPGMYGIVPGATQPKRGFNLILWTDFVGNYGTHLGGTKRMATPHAFNPFKGGALAHFMGTVILALQGTTEWANKSLDDCLAASPKGKYWI